jgi:hypothetical protein
MAVTIDEMQVDVRSGGSQPSGQAAAPAPNKEPDNLCRKLEMIAERSLRLKTD